MDDEIKPNKWRSTSPEQYLQYRVNDQLSWHTDKGMFNKDLHHRLQLITMIAAASIPVISLFFMCVSWQLQKEA